MFSVMPRCSAINSIEDSYGHPDPALGAAAMAQAVDVFRCGIVRDVQAEEHVGAFAELATAEHLAAL
jgi:hypothetical protein